jgi:tetratricopeptide (TPR) repeat protein
MFLGADEEAVTWYHRAIQLDRNYWIVDFNLAATLAELGQLDEARAEAQAGLALEPKFTLRRYRAGAATDNPVFLKRRVAATAHKVATPVNWKNGEDVIIAGSVTDDDAKKQYPQGWKA